MNVTNENDVWAQKWNERYGKAEFAYGEAPNNYLKEQLEKLPAGNILFGAEGEGRNAVYAAQLGWQVTAFDISSEGKNKAMQLAKKNNVQLSYLVGSLETMPFAPAQFDVVALIYAHFPAGIKARYHQMLGTYLRAGGIVIFEAFSKKHIDYVTANPRVGGPKEIDVLFSIAEIKADFPNYEFLELEEKEIELSEGIFHNGTGMVIRFVAKKMADR